MKRGLKIALFCFSTLIFIGCDQVTKELAKAHLKDKAVLSYYHDTFRLDYVENTGAFLSFGEHWPPVVSFWLLNILPLVFLLGLFMYAIKKMHNQTFLTLLPFLLICSGGLGNVIDRMLYDRHVTDFMNLGINNLRTGIFNFADVYVSTGAILLLVMQWRQTRNKNSIA